MSIQKIRDALKPFAKHAAEELDRFIPPAITADDATPIWGGPWHDTVITVGDFKRIRAALALLDGMAGDEWQPIETAPKGPGQLILGHAEQRWIRFGRYYPEFRKWYYSGTNERQQYSETEGGTPTHWRPLPPPPALTETKR